jgi:hypothetical protein
VQKYRTSSASDEVNVENMYTKRERERERERERGEDNIKAVREAERTSIFDSVIVH